MIPEIGTIYKGSQCSDGQTLFLYGIYFLADHSGRALTVFARSNAGILGSNPIRGMDVCARLFCVCVVLCVGSGLATG
jgi:hypothetical protein